jgi:hypothetical protein
LGCTTTHTQDCANPNTNSEHYWPCIVSKGITTKDGPVISLEFNDSKFVNDTLSASQISSTCVAILYRNMNEDERTECKQYTVKFNEAGTIL